MEKLREYNPPKKKKTKKKGRKKGGWTRYDFKENSILISFIPSFFLLPS
jgi:hypothetical protein